MAMRQVRWVVLAAAVASCGEPPPAQDGGPSPPAASLPSPLLRPELDKILAAHRRVASTSAIPVNGLSMMPAADVLVRAFDRVPLVAFSEPGHGYAGTGQFLASVIRHPRFAGTVNDIVVEFGNARYQRLADRYVAGEHIPRDELKQIWENTTVVSGIWTAPVYEGFLNEVRALNVKLPPERRVRVLLGDPPIDWNAVRGPADEDMNDWRDAHFAWVVGEQVLKRRRRALLWIGGAHWVGR